MDTKEKQKTVSPKKRTATKRPASAVGVKTPQKARNSVAPERKTVKKAPPKRAPKRVKSKAAPERQPSPDVVYTEPGLFSKSRLILRLATATAVVLALIFGISIFFKVKDYFFETDNEDRRNEK